MTGSGAASDVRRLLAELAGEDFCDLRTVGRKTGLWRTVELWFAVDGDHVAFLSGGDERADWVRNLQARGTAEVVVRDRVFAGRASFPAGMDRAFRVRQLLASKYQRWSEGRPMSSWAARSLPVEIVVEGLVPGPPPPRLIDRG